MTSRSMRLSIHRVAALVTLLLVHAVVMGAFAQEPPAEGSGNATERSPSEDAQTRAAALFQDARALMDQKRYVEACPKLEEAAALAEGVGILFNLASCHQQIGRTASAWKGFLAVEERMRLAGQSERRQDAAQRVRALVPQLTYLRIAVTRPADGMAVTLNGKSLGRAQWDKSVAVDPGTYSIRAEAPERKAWSAAVKVLRAGPSIKVLVPELERSAPISVGKGAPKPPTPTPHANTPKRPATPKQLPPPPHEDDAPSWQLPAGIVGMSLGGAGVAVAGALAVAAKLKADAAECDDNDFCSDAGVQDRASAVAMGNVATGVMIGGAVLAGVGLVVWLTAPDEVSADASSTHPRAARVRFHTNGHMTAADLVWSW